MSIDEFQFEKINGHFCNSDKSLQFSKIERSLAEKDFKQILESFGLSFKCLGQLSLS